MASEDFEDIGATTPDGNDISIPSANFENAVTESPNPYEHRMQTPNSESKPNRRKTSFVWDYFTVSQTDIRKAICNNCGAEIVRGKDTRSFGTTSLASHIKYCHRSSIEGPDGVSRPKRKRPSSTSLSRSEQKLIKSPKVMFADDIETYVSPGDIKVLKDVICTKRMDLIHSGMVMNVLYEQHRSGKFCDLTLISAPIVSVQPSIPHTTDGILTTGKKGNKKIFKAHSSVLAAVSQKIKTLIEMGSRTIELKDVSSFGLKSMLEIIYTGKLRRKVPLKFVEAHQIWKAASDLGVKYVHDYLTTEHPQVAKWIADEEKHQRLSAESDFVYEITEEQQNNDLVDLCGAEPSENYEETPGGDEEAKDDEPFGDDDTEMQQEIVKQNDDKNEEQMVEITFDKT